MFHSHGKKCAKKLYTSGHVEAHRNTLRTLFIYQILESQLSPLLRMVAKFFGPCPGSGWSHRLATFFNIAEVLFRYTKFCGEILLAKLIG